ncbi:hypothetical protein FGIG_10080 [Fasciola gigantica]|uniref:Uncharacterized protein n=1 Tax=Fasciola gigantica TaxID=46835 RepID=A0A504Z4V4_FASGI|nr:hypothetical protein FGIG_10080 [Fasciola gigantica]
MSIWSVSCCAILFLSYLPRGHCLELSASDITKYTDFLKDYLPGRLEYISLAAIECQLKVYPQYVEISNDLNKIKVGLSDKICLQLKLPKASELEAKKDKIHLPETMDCHENVTE